MLPSTATACRRSTSTTWSRGWPSWRRRPPSTRRSSCRLRRGARSYANDIMLANMIDALDEMYPHIPLCMHQDHGNDEATCPTAIQHGFTSVMMDGSLKADAKTAADYDYNVEITRRVADMAHWVGASVEGELGVLGSLETRRRRAGGRPWRRRRGQPRSAADRSGPGGRFRRATRVDALAIAWAPPTAPTSSRASPTATSSPCTSSRRSTAGFPNTHLVMHGSSSVPQELQDVINAVRRRDAADLGRAGRGDRSRHQARRPQGQHRHRLPPGDDRGSSARSQRKTRSEFDPRKFLKPAMERCATSAASASSSSAPPAMPRRSESIPMARWPSATRGALDPRIASNGRRRAT